ncbi:MAG: outer membrane beta-barrel protein [Candidatus Aminicenantaceae bacterium]
MKKLTGIMIVLLLLTGLSYGQRAYIAGMSYMISSPTGNTKDFIDKTSYLGFSLEGRKFLSDYFSLGASFQWNSFLQEEVGGTLAQHSMNAYPLMATLHFYPSNNNKFIPYAGVGLGGLKVFQREEKVLSIEEQSAWLFGVVPELGAIVRLGSDVGLLFNIKYVQGFEAGEMPTQSFFSYNFGFLWLLTQ